MRVTVCALSILLSAGSATPQSGSSAPSTTPQLPPDTRGRMSGSASRARASIDIQKMAIEARLLSRVDSALKGYLNGLGATPAAGTTHIFYVRVINTGNMVRLRNYQYLTAGRNSEDALREAFALENAPETQDEVDVTGAAGGFFVVDAVDGMFQVRGLSYGTEWYEEIKREGLALRDKRAAERAEALRIQKLRKKNAAKQRSSEARAQRNLREDMARGLPRSGVEIGPGIGGGLPAPGSKGGPIVRQQTQTAGGSPTVQPSAQRMPQQTLQMEVPRPHRPVPFGSQPPVVFPPQR